MLLSELYNMEDAYKCKTNDDALKLFEKLQRTIGTVYMRYKLPGVVSGRQHATCENAIHCILCRDYIQAITEVYDFLENYGDNNHELTNPEYMMLDAILHLVSYQQGFFDLVTKQKVRKHINTDLLG